MGKVIVCYCIESEGTDPGRSSVSTGETNDIVVKCAKIHQCAKNR